MSKVRDFAGDAQTIGSEDPYPGPVRLPDLHYPDNPLHIHIMIHVFDVNNQKQRLLFYGICLYK